MRITPRLRVTSLLSLLALLIGVLGTQWLSGRTADWTPRHAVAAVHVAPPAIAYRGAVRASHAPPRIKGAGPTGLHAAGAEAVAPPPPPPALVPLSMPQLEDRYDAMRGHLQGSLVLSVSVDGSGSVRAVSVRRSSGDEVLDAYADRLVRGWRFAVPPDQPEGLTGDLPMHFGMDGASARLP